MYQGVCIVEITNEIISMSTLGPKVSTGRQNGGRTRSAALPDDIRATR